MTTKTLLIAGGVVGAGAVAYLLLKGRNANASTLSTAGLPPTAVTESASDAAAKALAQIRAVAGARATTGASAGLGSMMGSILSSANAKNSQAIGAIGNKVIPGSGAAFEFVGRAVGGSAAKATTTLLNKASSLTTSSLKKLKFW